MDDGRDIDTYYGDDTRNTSGATTEQLDIEDDEDSYIDEDRYISNDISWLS